MISISGGVVSTTFGYDNNGNLQFFGLLGAAARKGRVGSRLAGHEMLDTVRRDPTRVSAAQRRTIKNDLDLVHMNGRIYDPIIGRFMSADPITEAPNSSQGWNRYSYVGNSPVNFTDPSGYCFMGCFWNKAFRGLGNLIKKYPIIGSIIKIAAAALCGPGAIACAAITSFVTSAFITGVTGGSLSQALRAGLISAATVVAFQPAGDGVQAIAGTRGPAFGTVGHIFKIASHAGVGCLSAMAGGGSCGKGALAAAVSAGASPFLVNTGSFAGNIAAHAVVGGLASVAAGGRFGDGAATAAFGYMFNFEGVGRLAVQVAGPGILGALMGPIGFVASMVVGSSPAGDYCADKPAACAPNPTTDGESRRQQYVVRGGTCTEDRFCFGSGITIDSNGHLQGVSVQSFPNTSVQELSQRQWIPQNQIGVSTVDAVEAAGGTVVPAPTANNPYHATLSGITPQAAVGLFNPTMLNPNPRK